ncbi:MAG: hypothetical protein C3F17_14200 [Bradyrhizobiaceae bacterium]|nr:MAG: hypothetical protein C3F17_14200 [Bradyrhizobiaceae bacterium]
MADPTAIQPETFLLADDGSIPNNPSLPLLVYRGGIDLAGTPDPAEVIEAAFRRNGWGDMWRNGIYPFVHYHSMIHEVLGMARGGARVRFGGEQGVELDLRSGDVAVLPAGTGHQNLWATPDLLVVGAYPPEGRLDLCRGSRAEHARALKSIPRVPVPESDPVFGADGPLVTLWRR